MTRAVFMQGRSPCKFMPAFHMKLFLSANTDDVAEATALGYPAGQVVGSATQLAADDPEDRDLRIAFDFDAVLADDSAERVYATEGMAPRRGSSPPGARPARGPCACLHGAGPVESAEPVLGEASRTRGSGAGRSPNTRRRASADRSWCSTRVSRRRMYASSTVSPPFPRKNGQPVCSFHGVLGQKGGIWWSTLCPRRAGRRSVGGDGVDPRTDAARVLGASSHPAPERDSGHEGR
jgi:hypothetical protein